VADRILVVDDHPPIRLAITGFLRPRGHEVEEAGSVAETKEAFESSRYDAVILDYVLPDGDALELMAELLEEDPSLPVILLTGHGSIELAVEAMRKGAENFLTKPVDLEALELVLERALKGRRVERKYLAVREGEQRESIDPFVGESRAIRELEREARLALRTESPVLLEGDTGTGKGVLASWIHQHGPRAEEAFVDLNCAGLTTEFLESELFGHTRGAFTGAVEEKKGLLEIADRGVLFLDEIGDTELPIQAKLLKAVEEQRFRKLGSVRDQRVDVQLLAATNRDLQRLCDEGSFRPDLYFRISTLVLRLPALRDRTEDIPALARAILDRLARHPSSERPTLSNEALERLRSYTWPGNIRELRNVLERALLLCTDEVIHPRHLRLDPRGEARRESGEGRGRLEQAERREIERALAASRGVITDAAESLGISRSTLYNKIEQFGIELASFRAKD
jgi:DNA-binding NtrC family response regulator